jgi:prevent-host-death family protein
MKRVGIFEAKTRLSSLLDEVEKGGEVVISRHGKAVARLVRAEDQRHSPEAIERRRQAIAELRKMARRRGLRISHDEIKSWIEDGRH